MRMIGLEEHRWKHPHSVATLKFPSLPSPRWFQARSSELDAYVEERGVFVHGDYLELIEGALPPVGTRVKLQLERTFIHVEEAEKYEARKKAEFAAVLEERQLDHRRQLAELQAHAETENAKLNIPVRWTSGEKTVLSGLSFNSAGDGRNRRSVNHVLLLEPISEGRFTRDAESFLCTSASGSNGENWTDDPTTYSVGNEGNYVSCINCAQCLKLAMRWENSLTRVEPELAEHDSHGFRLR